MSGFLIPLSGVRENQRAEVGGKAATLARLLRLGMHVVPGMVITAEAYHRYMAESGLREKIVFEIGRKPFREMRWEEIWDLALRIRNHFLKTPLPPDLEQPIALAAREMFADRPVVVRSSAPDEDGAAASFAGLHESYVNMVGTAQIIRHIRLVWASLWSDRALLYRRELKLDPSASAMAVLIQPLLFSRVSGVLFTRNPNDASQMVIEAVYGLNQGLVDGTVEPDRWFIAKSGGGVLSHQPPAARIGALIPSIGGTAMDRLAPDRAGMAPLAAADIRRLWEWAVRLEAVCGAPQDIEWSFAEETLWIMQARPITAAGPRDAADQRSWYLSLHRSFENLKALQRRVEQVQIPAMQADAANLSGIDLHQLTDRELADELLARKRLFDKWGAVYRDDFIPFAHGMRLFGQVYNDLLTPDNPFEFMELLKGADLESLRRNRELVALAGMLAQAPGLVEALEAGREPADGEFSAKLNGFLKSHAILLSLAGDGAPARQALARLLVTLSRQANKPEKRTMATHRERIQAMESAYMDRFPAERRALAGEILAIGRASYRLRDDDNIHLGRIEAQLKRAAAAAGRRVARKTGIDPGALEPEALARALTDPAYQPSPGEQSPGRPLEKRPPGNVRLRQWSGQPASPGIAAGPARVIRNSADLFDVQAGEVLVCDAVDPNLTFVIPMTVAIVERRGGMLIHGAIIAREYGIPCVTGIPGATDRIPSGAVVTVDGYLGLVTVAT